MTHHMSRCWADPDWRERQKERLAEGRSRVGARVPGRALLKHRKPNHNDFVMVTFGCDAETNDKLVVMAQRAGKSRSEIIRTYVEWGLEQEGDNR